MINWVKNKWKKIIAALGVTVVMLGSPVFPKDMEWMAYETVRFNTSDGDLAEDEYALAGNGEYYVRETPKDEGFVITTTIEPIGKKLVAVVCERCTYYSIFRDSKGKNIRVPYEGRYQDLQEIKNAPQPKRTEMVSFLNTAQAAVTFNASSSLACAGSATSISWAHSASGVERALAAGASMADATQSDMDIATATYNGTLMTPGERAVVEGGATDNAAEVWYMVAPDTGSNTISLTYAGTVSGSCGHGISFTEVNQSAPLDDSAANTASAANGITTNVTTTVADTFIYDIVAMEGALSGLDVASGQTINAISTGLLIDSGSSRKAATSTGSFSMGWTESSAGTGEFSHVVLVFAPSGEAPTSTARRRNPPPVILE